MQAHWVNICILTASPGDQRTETLKRIVLRDCVVCGIFWKKLAKEPGFHREYFLRLLGIHRSVAIFGQAQLSRLLPGEPAGCTGPPAPSLSLESDKKGSLPLPPALLSSLFFPPCNLLELETVRFLLVFPPIWLTFPLHHNLSHVFASFSAISQCPWHCWSYKKDRNPQNPRISEWWQKGSRGRSQLMEYGNTSQEWPPLCSLLWLTVLSAQRAWSFLRTSLCLAQRGVPYGSQCGRAFCHDIVKVVSTLAAFFKSVYPSCSISSQCTKVTPRCIVKKKEKEKREEEGKEEGGGWRGQLLEECGADQGKR